MIRPTVSLVPPTAVVTTPAQERALDAAVELVARWGLTKTTLGDVARTAGMGRATLYRAFPGGRDQLVDMLGQREVAGFLQVVADAFDVAPDLPSALADGLHAAATHLEGHAAARFVLEHEPELAVPVLGFAEMDRLLMVARLDLAPHLAPHLDPEHSDRAERAGWAVEWLARMFLSSLVTTTSTFDLTDADACRRLVARYVVPALVSSPRQPLSTSA
ncbi:hypothetical protein BH24ACT4_BH24ACT4_01960 [soil metagenome]